MKSMSTLAKGCALVLFASFASACNPLDLLDPRTSPASGASDSAIKDLCAADRRLGYCPPRPPKDVIL